jgi:murein DD-endopeptidase MepM/ murein hydrolase activator NlpD
MPYKVIVWICLAAALAACRPSNQAAFSATVPAANSQPRTTTNTSGSTAVPTALRMATRTSTPLPTATNTATPPPSATATASSTPLAIHSPTPGAEPTDSATAGPTWTPPPDDPGTRVEDHYHLYRPIAEGNTNYVDRTYPYGSTQGGQLQVHHGVEFINPRGTPILAAADGRVVYAGEDTTEMFGPTTNYYGRLVVIEHAFRSPGGEPVYSLYGHLERWDVQTGDTVSQGDQIGIVGSAGVAYGPHLHFEVRVGSPNDFGATRNPELWIFPFRGFGTLAGRVVDADGNVLYEAPVQVRSVNLARYGFTYADGSVNPDTTIGENFTIGDLPANYYEVSVTADGRVRFRRTIYVYANRTTWINIELNP